MKCRTSIAAFHDKPGQPVVQPQNEPEAARCATHRPLCPLRQCGWSNQWPNEHEPRGRRNRQPETLFDARQYLTQAAIAEFTDRAKVGDFAQVPAVPKRNEKISGPCVRAGESKQ
jgi:hypothetical protein